MYVNDLWFWNLNIWNHNEILWLAQSTTSGESHSKFADVHVWMHKLWGFAISKLGKKKNCYVALTRPKFKNWVGRLGFFYIFLRTVRELSFPIFFCLFLNGENSGGMQSKRIYKSCKCFFKPLNTNFSKFFAQIWHKKKKKNDPVFSHFTVGRERAT